jgi:aspartate racemase
MRSSVRGEHVKRIGLIGGMSWESSALYYRLINELIRERLGGFHSADCVMASVDFATIEAFQSAGDWEAAGELLTNTACGLEAAGADCVVLCTNTMHKVADRIVAATTVPFIHLIDVTAETILAHGLRRVALLGTRFTMEQSFYVERMRTHGIHLLIPDDEERLIIDGVIYGELVHGIARAESRDAYRRVINRLVEQGAQGVILGCTEIELLIGVDDAPVPVFPTTAIHVAAAVDFALQP